MDDPGKHSTVDASPLDLVDDPSATDPLSEVTRRERKALLGGCVIGLAISAGGLVPDEITTFGITIKPDQEESLYYILAGVIGYLVLAFVVYAWADQKRREVKVAKGRERIRPAIENATTIYSALESKRDQKSTEELLSWMKSPEFLRLGALSDQIKFTKRVQRVGSIRVLVDIYLPIVLGGTTMLVVWSSTKGFIGWSWVALGALTVSVLVAVLFSWLRWRLLYRWWRRMLNHRRKRRQEKLMRKIKALEKGDPRAEALAQKARDLLMRAVDDLKDGIY